MLASFVGVLATRVDAHPISLTDAVINVTEKMVDVQLRVLAEDLVLYQNVSLNEGDKYSRKALIEAANKHQSFVLAGLVLRDEKGNRLKGQISKIDTDKLNEQGVLQWETKQASVTYSIQFRFSRSPFLAISQQFGGEKAVLPALMDCMILQDDVLVEKPVQLMGSAKHTVRFDWDQPPKKAKNWRELRARREAEFRRRLGIASYSGLYSFLYITEHEIRHEILVPVLTLESWVRLKRADSNSLTIAEQKASYKAIDRLMADKARIRIDGLSVRPVIERVSFFGLNINDFALNAKPRDVSVHNARVGIILSYSTKGMPSKISMKWELFSKHAMFLKSIVLAFDKEPAEHFFRESEQHFVWQRERARSQGPIALTARSGKKLDQKGARQLLATLLRNTYRAFDYRDEGDTYDALALSVHGDLLRRTYLQIRKGLLMAEQGGARAKVVDVKVTKAELIDSTFGEFVIDITWQVTGSVEHWGHIHTRRNEYQARFTVRGEKHWKIEQLQVNGQKRLEFKTSLRGVEAD
jgi:hypothetical protein